MSLSSRLYPRLTAERQRAGSQTAAGQLVDVRVLTPSPWRCVDLGEAEQALRGEGALSADYGLLELLLDAAHNKVEQECDLALMAQTVRAKFQLPAKYLVLPRYPFQELTTVTRIYQGTATALSTSGYYVEGTRPAKLFATSGLVGGESAAGILRVDYVAGWGDVEDAEPTAVPALIRQAILVSVVDWYLNPASVVAGTVVAKFPDSANKLLQSFKLRAV